MVNDDLGSWLKAAAENKITAKNAWKSTLIDHFANVDGFRESQGINFQKASCTLDGCVKVYSSRVDDVSENATRLLEGFHEDVSKKRSGRRQPKSTVEKSLSNLNIKTGSSKTYFDPRLSYVLSLPEGNLLMHNLEMSSDGVFRMSSARAEDAIVMSNVELSMSVPPGLLISPSMGEYREVEDMAVDSVGENDIDFHEVSMGFSESCGDEESAVNEVPRPVFRETPFTYFKGWAGPGHWKIRSRRTAGGVSKPKERFFMDFAEAVDHEGIAVVGNTLFEQSSILERREIQHTLPQDFRLEIEDLYKYLVRGGSFSSASRMHEDDVSIPIQVSSFVVEEPVDEFIVDTPVQELQQARFSTPFRKRAKKVDIKRLKDNILASVERKGHTNLSSVLREVPSMYDEDESKEISIHLCIVSLLHLANEKGIRLKEVGNNIEIDLPE